MNEHRYEIIGVTEPKTLTLDEADELEKHIDNICKKYGLKYLDTARGNNKIPIEELFKLEAKIEEGNNRHEGLLRALESLIARNKRLLSLDEIKELAMKWNHRVCSSPLDDIEFEKQWKCATRFIARNEEGNEDEREEAKGKWKGQYGDKQSEVEMSCLAELESKIPGKDLVDFVINTAKKTVKQEDTLVRQILYTGLSAHTNDPLNLGIIAPTSEGKTYPVIEVMKFFPIEDVWYIGHMSPMTLVRQKGILVNKNNHSIGAIVKKLKKEMFLLGNGKQDKAKMLELKEQLSELLENSKRLIDLNGRIILFLEPPHPELWDKIKPILSHDKLEIEFPYVDKSDRDGISTQNVVVRGWPACIFCSAKDESKWPQWPEIVSRFLITSPNMIPKKYQESNLLIAQRKGLPSLLQQEIILSDEDIRIAKQCILYIKREIQKRATAKENNNLVWIPYGEILAEILPGERGTDNRVTKRIFSLLDIIPLTKSHLRPKLIYGSETLVVATLEDLREVLRITQNLNGIPTYKMKFFKELFNPLYRSKNVLDKSSDGSKEERIIAVTARQLCEYYKEKTGKTINSDSLRKIYLIELLNNGIIEEENSVIDQRQKIYYSLVDLPAGEQQEESNEEEIKKIREQDQSHNFSYPYTVNMPKNCSNIQEDWLIFQILALLNCRIGLSEIALLSHLGNKMTIAGKNMKN